VVLNLEVLMRLKLIVALSMFLILSGCQITEIPSAIGITSPDMSDEDLRKTLMKFCADVAASLDTASREIALKTTNREAVRNVVIWKIFAAEDSQRAFDRVEPRVALIDLWTLTYQMYDFINEGQGRSLFAEGQEIAVESCRSLVARIEQIGAEAMGDELYEKVREDLLAFAKENPIASVGTRIPNYPSRSKNLGDITFGWLSSFNPLQMSEVGEASVALEEFTYVLDGLPEKARWNTELLLLDIDESRSLNAGLEDFHRISLSAENLAKTFRELPEEAGKQIDRTLEKVEDQHEELGRTLAEARNVVVEVGETLDRTDRVVGSVGQASDALARAGEAWVPTLRELHSIIEGNDEEEETTKEAEDSSTSEESEPFEINDYTRSFQEASTAAVELRSTLAEIRGLIQTDEVADRLDDVDAAARSAVDHTATRAEDLTDHLTWRAILLVAVILAAALIYRVASVWILRKGRVQPST
jgi:hypothetical protein